MLRAIRSFAARCHFGRYGGAVAFGVAAAIGVASAWGFTVDDALISARVAHNIAEGHGYRFNPDGPIVDCVTPLGWAFLLAPVAGAGAWQAMTSASVLGACVWVVAATWLGWRCSEQCSGWRRIGIAFTLASCLPFGAWAVSGMETGLVMALGVGALAHGWGGALALGVAAMLRPELVPWAVALALGTSIARREPLAQRARALALSIVPALAVALVRRVTFDHAAPLAVFAKPSDFEHGLRYGIGALALMGPPYLLLAGSAWRQLPREHWAIAAALGVHWLVLIGVGGDWMPFWRLAMPTLPGVLLVGAALAARSGPAANAARLLAVLGCATLLHVTKGRDARAVRADRARMMSSAAPLLAGAERVASVDVGWVAAAGPHSLVDLAGVTDEEVAYLPGGHTSKRLPVDFLERRDVDALVLLLAPGELSEPPRFARHVEGRCMTLRGAERFSEVGRVNLNPQQDYVVLRRSAQPSARAAPR